MKTKKFLFTTISVLGISALLFCGWVHITYAEMESVEKLFTDSPVAPSNDLKINISHANAYAILNHINEQRALYNKTKLTFDAELLLESERTSYKCDDPNLDNHKYISDQVITLHGPQTSEEVITALFNNPDHVKKLLDNNITQIGIGHTSATILVKTENNEVIEVDDPNQPITCWAICLK